MIVYKVTNILNGKIYIGITTRNLSQRKRCHYSSKDKYRFHDSLHKYNKDAFTWEIIDYATSIDELKQKEIYWIKFYNSFNFDKGYNSTLGGDIPWSYGVKMSNKTKKKLSKLNKGKKNAFYGKTHSSETKNKLKEIFTIPYEQIKQMFECSGYKILTHKKDYIDSRSAVMTLCPNGHQWNIRPYAFKKGTRCKKCNDVLKKISFNEVINNFKNCNYTVISTREEYENSTSKYKIKFICNNNHKGEIWYHNFIHGHRCKQCSIALMSSKRIKQLSDEEILLVKKLYSQGISINKISKIIKWNNITLKKRMTELEII